MARKGDRGWDADKRSKCTSKDLIISAGGIGGEGGQAGASAKRPDGESGQV
jgi:hypothetical protein